MKCEKLRKSIGLFLLLSCAFCYSQTEENKPDEIVQESESTIDTFELKRNAFFITAGPLLMINTDDKTKSAPSPIMYELGIGYDFFQDKMVCGQVRASFFTNYYLWDGKNAQPAEIENRTATGLSFMIDALAGRTWQSGLNQFTLLGGFGILARFAMLSNGVQPDDLGGANSTASEDVSSINNWFHSVNNLLYPQIAFSYLRAVPDIFGKVMFGGEFRAYMPLGAITSGDFLDNMIFSLAFKLQF